MILDKPRLFSYVEHSSNHYGTHTMSVCFPNGFQLWFSYQTVIAFQEKAGDPIIVRENDFSSTTNRHMYNIKVMAKENRISSKKFEQELNDILKSYNLV